MIVFILEINMIQITISFSTYTAIFEQISAYPLPCNIARVVDPCFAVRYLRV
jgi:hypothetical protein